MKKPHTTTHDICTRCWAELEGHGLPVRGSLELVPCCFCGEATSDGLLTIRTPPERWCDLPVHTWRVEDHKCPTCRAPLSSATVHPSSPEVVRQPKPGDYSICFNCGEFLEFTDALQSRSVPIPEDMDREQRSSLVDAQRFIRAGA